MEVQTCRPRPPDLTPVSARTASSPEHALFNEARFLGWLLNALTTLEAANDLQRPVRSHTDLDLIVALGRYTPRPSYLQSLGFAFPVNLSCGVVVDFPRLSRPVPQPGARCRSVPTSSGRCNFPSRAQIPPPIQGNCNSRDICVSAPGPRRISTYRHENGQTHPRGGPVALAIARVAGAWLARRRGRLARRFRLLMLRTILPGLVPVDLLLLRHQRVRVSGAMSGTASVAPELEEVQEQVAVVDPALRVLLHRVRRPQQRLLPVNPRPDFIPKETIQRFVAVPSAVGQAARRTECQLYPTPSQLGVESKRHA